MPLRVRKVTDSYPSETPTRKSESLYLGDGTSAYQAILTSGKPVINSLCLLASGLQRPKAKSETSLSGGYCAFTLTHWNCCINKKIWMLDFLSTQLTLY